MYYKYSGSEPFFFANCRSGFGWSGWSGGRLGYQSGQDGGGGQSKRLGSSEQSVGRGVSDRVVRVVGVVRVVRVVRAVMWSGGQVVRWSARSGSPAGQSDWGGFSQISPVPFPEACGLKPLTLTLDS